MQVFKCVSHRSGCIECTHEMHLFSLWRRLPSFLAELLFDKHLFFFFPPLSFSKEQTIRQAFTRKQLLKESRAGRDFASDNILEKYLLADLMMSCVTL